MAETEVKVWGAVLGSAGVGAVTAVLNSVQADPNLLGNLPTPIQALILLVIPPFVTWLGGYFKKSKTSTTSDGFRSVNG